MNNPKPHELVQTQWSRCHDGRLVPSAVGAVPIASRLSCYLNALEVEPLDGTRVVVAGDHPSLAFALAAGATCLLIFIATILNLTLFQSLMRVVFSLIFAKAHLVVPADMIGYSLTSPIENGMAFPAFVLSNNHLKAFLIELDQRLLMNLHPVLIEKVPPLKELSTTT